MSTENITRFGPNTADIGTYAATVSHNPPGSDFMEGTVIRVVDPKTVRVCYSRGPENCYACVHIGHAKGKGCEVPATSSVPK